MKLYQKIKNETLGKNFDIDHAYGNQCWDFVCYVFEHYYNGKRIHCGLTTYVQDFVTQKETNGILEFMDDIGLNTILEPGDVCVWGQCSAAPYSHVALYDSDNGSNQVFFFRSKSRGTQSYGHANRYFWNYWSISSKEHEC